MTKLTPNQERLIAKLNSLKESYDYNLSVLQAEFDAAKEDLKNPIREAVVEAQDAGVPVRQIHQRGLGWQQVASMVNFLEPKPETLGQRLKRLTQPVTATVENNGRNSSSLATVSYETQAKLKMVETKPGHYSITDRDGDEWPFVFLGVAGGGIPLLMEGHEAFSISEDGDAMRELIATKFPNVQNLDNSV